SARTTIRTTRTCIPDCRPARSTPRAARPSTRRWTRPTETGSTSSQSIRTRGRPGSRRPTRSTSRTSRSTANGCAAAAEGERTMGEFAVLGSPIVHSLSPDLHTAAARALGLTGFRYGRVELAEADLEDFLEERPDLVGLSLTMPLKRRLVELAGARGWRIDADARATGGGNTLLRPAAGDVDVLNTDVAGIVDAVGEALTARGADAPPWADEAEVLGAGATDGSA